MATFNLDRMTQGYANLYRKAVAASSRAFAANAAA
jgi:hypothetical protein